MCLVVGGSILMLVSALSGNRCRLHHAEIKPVLICGTFAILGAGCTTTSEIAEVRAIAEEALEKANAAEACCRANEEKFDRMFKKSMYK